MNQALNEYEITRKAREVNEMNPNMMELTLDELAMVDGGDWLSVLKNSAWEIGLGAACGAAAGSFAGPVGAIVGAAAGAVVTVGAKTVGAIIANK